MLDINKVKKLSNNIRKHALMMTSMGGSSHIGSVLSISDILAVLYGSILNYNSKDPKWENRDRFILSKGHAGAGVYAALAESGFMPLEKLKTHYSSLGDYKNQIKYLNKQLLLDSLLTIKTLGFESDVIRKIETPTLIKEKQEV